MMTKVNAAQRTYPVQHMKKLVEGILPIWHIAQAWTTVTASLQFIYIKLIGKGSSL